MKQKFMNMISAAAMLLCMSISVFGEKMLIPVGKVVGLSVEEGSVIVTAYEESLGQEAKKAGIEIGDEITAVDHREIDTAADLHEALDCSDGSILLEISRNGKKCEIQMEPCVTDQGPKLGIYIREGITGIGTITYYDGEGSCFGALGHGISNQKGELAPMRSGYLYQASVESVKKGIPGKPGQLKGAVDPEKQIGIMSDNTQFGIFGTCDGFYGEALPVADSDSVREGRAEILSNITGDQVEVFTVEITKKYDSDRGCGRDLMIHVTDPKLLEQTGGIVAGMSGSPILQDGKLVGAVTHVLVNDPTRGYGILMENMLNAAA